MLLLLAIMVVAVGRIIYLQHQVSQLMHLNMLLSIPENDDEMAGWVNRIAASIHLDNAKWWRDLETGQPLKRNVGELLMLSVSELAEAMEGHRKNLPDDKLPHRRMFEVELADCVIRICDISAGMQLDLGGAMVEKLAFNRVREDHKDEHRKGVHGKKY